MFFKGYTKRDFIIKNADEEQIQIANELKGMGKGKMPVEKGPFLKNAGLFLGARKKILDNFKSKISPTNIIESEPEPTFATPKPAKERTKKSQPKLCRDLFD